MKRFRHLLWLLVIVLFVAFNPISRVGNIHIVNPAQAAVKISQKKLTLIKGSTYKLKITGAKKSVKWKTNKKKVATVSKKGIVTAKNKGTAVITAKVGKKKYKCTVKVETPMISEKKIELEYGKTHTLKITGTTQKIKWSSEDNSTATVSEQGVVTGTGEGGTYVIATIANKTYKCWVSVTEPDPTEQVTVKEHFIDGYLMLYEVINNSNYNVYVDIKTVCRNSEGKAIDLIEDQLQYVDAGRTSYIYDTVDNDEIVKFETSHKASIQSDVTQFIDKIEFNVTDNDGRFLCEIKNNSTEMIDYLGFAIVYYDNAGRIIDYEWEQFTDMKSKAVDYTKLIPSGEYSSYKPVILYAVHYED